MLLMMLNMRPFKRLKHADTRVEGGEGRVKNLNNGSDTVGARHTAHANHGSDTVQCTGHANNGSNAVSAMHGERYNGSDTMQGTI